MSQNKLKQELKERALNDLAFFIELIHPKRVLGSVHKELIRWWTREDAKSHQLVLLPRDHQKSAMIAYRVAWEITKNPAIRILYISSTSNLATKQLKYVKDILTSSKYRQYWPEMVNKRESEREKWTETEISVDHPKREDELVRDPTVFTAGLTTTITGLHCDIAVLDDAVTEDNADTKEGRKRVQTQYSYLSSITGTGGKQYVVGTRYHPLDLYNDMLNMTYDEYDEEGSIVDTHHLYEVFERQVESSGDGLGEFLWPKQQRFDGRWFGFDANELSKKRAQYTDITKFRAQYYNNPNDIGEASITPDLFNYFDRSHVSSNMGRITINGKRLNVFAAIDFAYSLNKRSDYSCIVVVGIDSYNNYYVLDIERFKSNRIKDYYDKIFQMHKKWHFRKLRAEVSVAQQVIVDDLKENYIRPNGLALAIDPYRPNRHEGTKEERIDATLQPRYSNGQVYHYHGGNCQVLEEELVMLKPAHDDVKDALASCIDICVPPSANMNRKNTATNVVSFNRRFGGVS